MGAFYIQYNEGRVTGLVTPYVGTLFLRTVLKKNRRFGKEEYLSNY